MYVRFWGTRGSVAAPGWRTAKFGGNTSCVEVRAPDGTLIVLDCGTGIRELGLHLLRTMTAPLRIHLFIGHTHWDHIQGFPFFGPAFMPGAEVNIHAPLGFQRSLGEAMAGQMESSYFPVKLKDLRSRIHFTELDEGFFRIGDVLVETQYLNHTAPTIAYRMTSGNSTVAYVTDHEPFWAPNGRPFRHPGDQRHLAFLKGADLVIHDAQYTEEEYRAKLGWGHSSINYATDIAMAAGVRRLALFHHDPTHADDMMERIEKEAQERVATYGGGLDVFAAREGLELEVKGSGTVAPLVVSSAFRRVPIVGCRVVVINPDTEEIASIERELAEDSLVLLSMPDARTALERVPDIMPDVAIVSRDLPDGDGAELVRRLRTALGRPDFPVVLLTSAPDHVDDLDDAEGAPTDYLARPFSPPMLRARVRSWLSRSLTAGEPSGAVDAEEAERPIILRGDKAISERYIDMLQSMPLFHPLSREQVQGLARGSVDQVYAPGHVIVREGTQPDSLFVILSGRVRVSESSRDTQAELILSEFGAGEIFGELGILRNQPRVATVVAVERTHCLVVRPSNFLAAIESAPGLALGLVQVLAARLTDADRKLARLAPDPLTGLMGRRAFVDQYRRLAAGARRRRTGALLIALDVLGLRSINDRFGYAIGDELLKAVAEALLEATRTTDLIARWGGDEFAVMLVDVEPKDADCVVERFRMKILEAGARRELPMGIRYSFGVAFTEAPPDSPDELFRAADADMHRRRTDRVGGPDAGPPTPAQTLPRGPA